MHTKKILGYILLAIGVLIIGCALFSSYRIFMLTNDPPQVFFIPVSTTEGRPASLDLENIEASMDALLQEQLGKLIPADTISKSLNLFAWSIFAGILIFGGAQLASLGIKLLRTLKQEKPI